MRNDPRGVKRSLLVLASAGWIGLGLVLPASSIAQTMGYGPGQGPTVGTESKSFGSSFKEGVDKFTTAITPKPTVTPPDNPTSLASKAKAGPELYAAMARLYEQAGHLPEAAQQYERALKDKPDDLSALLGYARVKERMDQPDEALKLYQRAAKVYPNEAAAFNNLGLYYARQRKLNDAVTALNRAIQLQPKKPLYRNNIATVLVEMGQLKEAFGHLAAVHSEAAAYYNLGYLLERKGLTEPARLHFAKAVELNPAMAEARQWLTKLGGMPDPEVSTAGPPNGAPARTEERLPAPVRRFAAADGVGDDASPPPVRRPSGVDAPVDRRPPLDRSMPADQTDRVSARPSSPGPIVRPGAISAVPEPPVRPLRLPPTDRPSFDIPPPPSTSGAALRSEQSERQPSLISPMPVGPDRRMMPPQ